jgi:hypothetical protein
MKQKKTVLTVILLVLLFPGMIYALGQDDVSEANTGLTSFTILNLPFGGEYEGMGTAYTAVGRDASYFDANPAASSTIERTELALVHNDWIDDSSIESAVYTQRKENLGLGFGAKVVHDQFNTMDEWGDQVYVDSKAARGRYTETVAGFNISYNFLSSFDFYGISAGSNLKIAYRNIPKAIYAHIDDVENQSAVMAMIDFGILTRFNLFKPYPSRERNFSAGIALRNFGPSSKGEPLPTRLDGGIAYSPLRPILFSFDINYPISLASSIASEKMGFAAGMSVKITDFLSTRTGFLMKGLNPRFTIGSSIALDRMTLDINYTLDRTTQYDRLERFSVQAKLDLGDFGREKLRKRIDELYIAAIEAYRKGNYRRSIEYCEEGLALDETFTPFREIMAIAQRVITNTNEILELQEFTREE